MVELVERRARHAQEHLKMKWNRDDGQELSNMAKATIV
jgi:hypothetical protein